MSLFTRRLPALRTVQQRQQHALLPRCMIVHTKAMSEEAALQELSTSATPISHKLLPSEKSTNTQTSQIRLQATPIQKIGNSLESISHQLAQVSISATPDTRESASNLRTTKKERRKCVKDSAPVTNKQNSVSSAGNPSNSKKKDSTPLTNKQDPTLSASQSAKPATAQKKLTSSSNKQNRTPYAGGKKQTRMMDTERDAKVSPSEASGGIPNASQQYLTLASMPYGPLPVAQHLLVVIDLNGTILYRGNRKQPTRFTTRPNAFRFLEYCIETFHVVIWSSARANNVTNLVNAIIPPALLSKVVAIWARDKFNLTAKDYNLRVQCYKRLTQIWDDPMIASSHPEFHSGRQWDQTNTVLVDDSIEKGRSEPYNLIEIPEFFGDEAEQGNILPQVHDYLNRLSMCSNVSACLKADPWKPQAVSVSVGSKLHQNLSGTNGSTQTWGPTNDAPGAWIPNSDETQILDGPPDNWRAQVERSRHQAADSYRPVQHGAPRTSDSQTQRVEPESPDWRVAAGLPTR